MHRRPAWERVLGRKAVIDTHHDATCVLRQQCSKHAVRCARCADHPSAAVKPHQQTRRCHTLRTKDDGVERAPGKRQAEIGNFNAVGIGTIGHSRNRLESCALCGGIFRWRQGAELFGKTLVELQDVRIDGHDVSGMR